MDLFTYRIPGPSLDLFTYHISGASVNMLTYHISGASLDLFTYRIPGASMDLFFSPWISCNQQMQTYAPCTVATGTFGLSSCTWIWTKWSLEFRSDAPLTPRQVLLAGQQVFLTVGSLLNSGASPSCSRSSDACHLIFSPWTRKSRDEHPASSFTCVLRSCKGSKQYVPNSSPVCCEWQHLCLQKVIRC